MKISKLYIKQNQVMSNVADIEKKEDINNFLVEGAKKVESKSTNQDVQFKGAYHKRQSERQDQINSEPPLNQKNDQREAVDDGTPLGHFETEREKRIKLFKRNSARLLHERNKYVF